MDILSNLISYDLKNEWWHDVLKTKNTFTFDYESIFPIILNEKIDILEINIVWSLWVINFSRSFFLDPFKWKYK